MQKSVKLVSLLLALMMIFSVGCSQPAAEEPDTGTGEETQEPASEGPQTGGTLIYGAAREPDSVNPFMANFVEASWVLDNIYPKLMYLDTDGNKKGYLAKDWTVSDDGLTWTVELQDGFMWEDGEAVTAEDVKFTFNYIYEHQLSWYAGLFNEVESMDVVDPLKLEITLNRPYPSFIKMVGFWPSIVPEHIWRDIEDPANYENTNPVGAGPYKLVEWKKGQYVELEAVEEFPLASAGRAHADALRLRFFPEPNTMVLALKKGEIDAIPGGIPAGSVEDLQSSDNVAVEFAQDLGWGAYVGFNLQPSEPYAGTDVSVRQALAYTIDKEAIVDFVLKGQGTALNSHVSPVLGDFFNPNLDVYEPDVDKANAILDDAGYADTNGDGVRELPDGSGDLVMEVLVPSNNQETINIAKMIATNAEKAGIKLKVKTMESQALGEKIRFSHDHQLRIAGWGILDDAAETLWLFYHCDAYNPEAGTVNRNGLCDDGVDQLLDEARHAPNLDIQKDKVWELQERLNELLPDIPLFVRDEAIAYRTDKLGGVVVYPDNLQGIMIPLSTMETYKKAE